MAHEVHCIRWIRRCERENEAKKTAELRELLLVSLVLRNSGLNIWNVKMKLVGSNVA